MGLYCFRDMTYRTDNRRTTDRRQQLLHIFSWRRGRNKRIQYTKRLTYLWCVSTICSECKGKGLDTCYSATYMSQSRDQQRLRSRKWQLIGMSQWCRSALCGHTLPALTDNWTHGASYQKHHRPNQPHVAFTPYSRVATTHFPSRWW